MIYIIISVLLLYIVIPIVYTCIRKSELSERMPMSWRFTNRFLLDRFNKVHKGIYGFSLFCGRQGGGKTYCAVELALNIARSKDILLISNTPLYVPADINYTYIEDINNIKYLILQDYKGFVILLDEIQTLFESKNFDESFYTIFCQLRKRNIKIIGTAQVFERVALKLREQVHNLYYCKTFFGCLTRKREYAPIINNSGKLKQRDVVKLGSKYLIQSDLIRNSYNTFFKI